MRRASTKIIENIYRRLLREASGEKDAASMAALVDESGNSKTAVVYNTTAISSSPEGAVPSTAIVGFVKISQPSGAPCRGAWQVKGITGPGGIVYPIAYALSPTGLVVPDRSEVSPEASAAWLRYSQTPAGKAGRLPLDDASHPAEDEDPFHDWNHTADDKSDDCYTSHYEPNERHLNYAYRGPGGESAVLNRLTTAHEALMKKLAGGGTDVETLESAILDAGYAAFDAVMGY